MIKLTPSMTSMNHEYHNEHDHEHHDEHDHEHHDEHKHDRHDDLTLAMTTMELRPQRLGDHEHRADTKHGREYND